MRSRSPRRSAAGLVLAVLAAVLVEPVGHAQQPAARPAPRQPDLVGAAREIMEAARYCTLITMDETGRPQARPMDAFAPEADLVVWLATNPRSRKVRQIERDSRVTLHYFDPQAQAYVTLFGTARLVNDPEEKKRWKDEWKAFYPDRDASYLLIAVTPERLEVFSPKHGIESDPVTWQPATFELRVRR